MNQSKIHNLGDQSSLVTHLMAKLRDVEIQKDRQLFRRNMERLGEIFGYEISKTLSYKDIKVRTTLGTAKCQVLEQPPVLGAILRAGIGLHQGLLNYFDYADNAFIAAFRKHTRDSFTIELEYLSCPSLDDRVLIIADPMLATGQSMSLTLDRLLEVGSPSKIHLAVAVASAEGLALVSQNHKDVTIWVAAIDEHLNDQAYIVPGLGDAGDLLYGIKMQK